MVKQIMAVLALLLLLPGASAESYERGRVHETYEVIITADVVLGLGVDIQQLGWICHLAYDATMPDSDPFDQSNTATALVTVSCSGPGTILFSQAGPPTLAILENDPSAVCDTEVVSFNTGASSTTRYGAGEILVTVDEDDPHPAKCSFTISVSVTETGEEWELFMPVTIFNDDSEPSGFEGVIGANALEFLLFWIIVAMAVFFWSRSKDEVVQIFMALLLLFAGAIAISLYAAWVGWVPMGLVIAVLGAYMLIRTGMEAYQR